MSNSSTYSFSFAAIALTVLIISSVDAFSTPTPRPFIEFTNPLARQQDRLPASFIKDWPTWVLDPQAKSWERIPDSDGFVPPTSLNELWQPQDLKPPQCQLAVGLHVRDGMIRHILPAVDLTLGGHRNRGLCSVPRAYEWMDFNAAVAGGLNQFTMTLQSRSEDSEEEGDWETMAEFDDLEDTIITAIEALAEYPPDELGEGSTVVHVLCEPEDEGDVVFCPRPGSEMRVLLQEAGSTVGQLQVLVDKTAPGSESEYLPEAYKPLYEDEEHRRPAFTEAKEILEAKAEANSSDE